MAKGSLADHEESKLREGMGKDSWSSLDFTVYKSIIPQQRIDTRNMAGHPEVIVHVTNCTWPVGWLVSEHHGESLLSGPNICLTIWHSYCASRLLVCSFL